jgi:hypothetical protein
MSLFLSLKSEGLKSFVGLVFPTPGLQIYSFSVGVVSGVAPNIVSFLIWVNFGSDYGR